MTTNTSYLADTLSRRIAHRETTPRDLVLLNRLIACIQLRGLLLGSIVGVTFVGCIEFAIVVFV